MRPMAQGGIFEAAVDDQVVAVAAAIEGIVAGASEQRVMAGPAIDRVVAVAAQYDIGAAASGQHVGAGRTNENAVLMMDQLEARAGLKAALIGHRYRHMV